MSFFKSRNDEEYVVAPVQSVEAGCIRLSRLQVLGTSGFREGLPAFSTAQAVSSTEQVHNALRNSL